MQVPVQVAAAVVLAQLVIMLHQVKSVAWVVLGYKQVLAVQMFITVVVVLVQAKALGHKQ